MKPEDIDSNFPATLNAAGAAAFQLPGLDADGKPNGSDKDTETARKVLELIKEMAEAGLTPEEELMLDDLTGDIEERIYDEENGGHIFTLSNCRTLLTGYDGPGGTVAVPEGVLEIDEEAFSLCRQVTEVILPEGLTAVGEKAFYKSGVRSVRFPSTLERIEESAFKNTQLESVELPDSLTELEEGAFSDNAQLKTVKLPARLVSIEPYEFAGCGALKEIIIPEGCEYIQGKAFKNCVSLKKVVLPESLKSVWHEAFSGCISLEEAVLGSSMKAVGRDAFAGCISLKKLYLSSEVEDFYAHALPANTELKVTGPGAENGIIKSGERLMYCLPENESLTIPSGVTGFDDDCFARCSGIKRLTIPEGVESIYSPVLDPLVSLEELQLPKSLGGYDWEAFAHLKSLKKIVTKRDALAAEIALLLDVECEDTDGVPFKYEVPAKPGKWLTKPDIFRNALCLTGLEGRIGHTADCDYTTLILPEEIDGRKVTRIGANAFKGLDTADAVYIPDSVEKIDKGAFSDIDLGYSPLFVRIPKGVKTAKEAFKGTDWFTIKTDAEADKQPEAEARQEADGLASAEAQPGVISARDRAAELAADDPAVGTGVQNRPKLKLSIWNYFDGLTREKRIDELKHDLSVNGAIDGAGWATVELELDGEWTRFRISYIGPSIKNFREWAEEIEDGDYDSFGWCAEPGWYEWRIQRRGEVIYVKAPNIDESFFIPRETFLEDIAGMTAGW